MSTGHKRVVAKRCRGEFLEYEYWMRRSKQTPVREHRRRFMQRALDHLDKYFELEDALVKE